MKNLKLYDLFYCEIIQEVKMQILKLVAFNIRELFIDCVMKVKETSLFQESLREDLLKDIFNCNFRKILGFISSYECLIVSIGQSLFVEISIQNVLPCVWREV